MTAIYSICNFENLTESKLISAAEHFGASNLHTNKNHSGKLTITNETRLQCQQAIQKTPKWKSAGSRKDPDDTQMCFNKAGKFVCFKHELRLKKHNIMLPQTIFDQFNNLHPSSNGKKSKVLFDFEDKIALLSQYCNLNQELPCFELKWSSLCIPQMRSVAKHLEVKLTDEQLLTNSANPRNFIRAKCLSARQFRSNYGNRLDFVLFGFSTENIFDFECLSYVAPDSQQLSNLPTKSKKGNNTPGLANLPAKSKMRSTPESNQEILDEFPKSTSRELTWYNLSKQQRISVLNKLGVKVSSSLSEVQYREKLLKNDEFTHRYLNSDAGLKGTSFVFTTKDPAKCVDIKTLKQPQPQPVPNKAPASPQTAAPQTIRKTAIEVIEDAHPSGYTQPSPDEPTSSKDAVTNLPTHTTAKTNEATITDNLNFKRRGQEDKGLEDLLQQHPIKSLVENVYDSASETDTRDSHSLTQKIKRKKKKKKKGVSKKGDNNIRTTETSSTPHLTYDTISDSDLSEDAQREERGTKLHTDQQAELKGPEIVISSDYKIRFAPRKHSSILEGFCTTCTKSCLDETIQCFICKQNVHYDCYQSKYTGEQIDTILFKHIKSTPSIVWRCDDCINTDFKDITDTITAAIQTRIAGTCQQMKVDMQTELKVIIEDTVEKSMEGMKNVLISKITGSHDTIESFSRETTENQLLYSQISQVTEDNPKITHTASKTPLIAVPKAKYTGRIPPPNFSPENKRNLDPKMSIIIRKVQNKKIASHDSYLKAEFNKHFNRMKINHCKRTRYGNILIELTSEEDVATVIKEWKPSYFANGNTPGQGTEAFRMNRNIPKRHAGVIRRVVKELEDTEIEKALTEEGFSEVRARRFKKLGDPLTTVMLTFSSEKDFNSAISNGVYIGRMHFRVDQYIPRKRPMQCAGCNKFGHPVKWCRNRQNCAYCSSTDHVHNECPHKETKDQYVCSNCNGNHSSWSHTCPSYIKEMTLISQVNQYE